jgi:hypothetical protein
MLDGIAACTRRRHSQLDDTDPTKRVVECEQDPHWEQVRRRSVGEGAYGGSVVWMRRAVFTSMLTGACSGGGGRSQAVTTKQGQDLADEFGIKFFETSAKSNTNIDEAFRSIAVDIQKRLAESEHDRLDVANGSKFRVDESQEQAKDGCC